MTRREKLDKKETEDVLERYGKFVLVAALIAFGGTVAYWLLKVVLFAVMIWFVLFQLPSMF